MNTYTGESHDDTQRDEQTDMSTRRYRDQHRGNDRHQNADTEHVLAAVAWRQPASQHLSDYVAVEERA